MDVVKSKLWLWEENGVFVDGGAEKYVVFRPSKSGTHSEVDSAYDRLDVALCRALYLARGPGRHAAEAMRLAEELR